MMSEQEEREELKRVLGPILSGGKG